MARSPYSGRTQRPSGRRRRGGRRAGSLRPLPPALSADAETRVFNRGVVFRTACGCIALKRGRLSVTTPETALRGNAAAMTANALATALFARTSGNIYTCGSSGSWRGDAGPFTPPCPPGSAMAATGTRCAPGGARGADKPGKVAEMRGATTSWHWAARWKRRSCWSHPRPERRVGASRKGTALSDPRPAPSRGA